MPRTQTESSASNSSRTDFTVLVARSDHRFMQAVAGLKDVTPEQLAGELIGEQLRELFHDPNYFDDMCTFLESWGERLERSAVQPDVPTAVNGEPSPAYFAQVAGILDRDRGTTGLQERGTSIVIGLDPIQAGQLHLASQKDHCEPEAWLADVLAARVHELKKDVDLLKQLSEITQVRSTDIAWGLA